MLNAPKNGAFLRVLMKNTQINYEDFKNAVEILELFEKIDKESIRKSYLRLSKKHHPDFGGEQEKFAQINQAYQILTKYIENFKFKLNKEEFKEQFPLSFSFNFKKDGNF